jgi:hypothetical protein
MYEEKPKGFIEELQSLDDVKKKRVLIISTVVIMAIVIVVWLSYFSQCFGGYGCPGKLNNPGGCKWAKYVAKYKERYGVDWKCI